MEDFNESWVADLMLSDMISCTPGLANEGPVELPENLRVLLKLTGYTGKL